MQERPEDMNMELVLQSQVGDDSAFEELVRLHFKGVFQFCRRYAKDEAEAEDLAQESFINCYRALRSVKGKNFKAWLYQIVLNVCRSNLRKRYREDRRVDAFRSEKAQEMMATRAQDPEVREIVTQQIDALPERQREVLTMRLYGGMSHDEIAEALGITYDDVKTNLSLARKKLTQALARFLEE